MIKFVLIGSLLAIKKIGWYYLKMLRGNRPDLNRTHKGKRNFHAGNAILSITGIAILVATIFTMWTPSNLFSTSIDNIYDIWQSQSNVIYPTPTQLPPSRIGIVAGHYGSDSGSVCSDGFTEMEANLIIATLVVQKLKQLGYTVDLLEEFDPRLNQYSALSLISIHNDSCDYINDQATGFKVAAPSEAQYQDRSERLEKCLIYQYHKTTNLKFHVNTITSDMTSYHTFNEISSETTAAIIETGFLNLDQEIIRYKPEIVADGIVAGIKCFIERESVPEDFLEEIN